MQMTITRLSLQLWTGELTDESGKKGILEIKTTTIQNSSQWYEWDGGVPQNYYIQVLHQMLATGWNFAVLKAHIRYFKNNDICTATRHYFIDRNEVQEDIKHSSKLKLSFGSMYNIKQNRH